MKNVLSKHTDCQDASAETRLRHRANVTSILNLFPEILKKSYFPDEMFL